MSIRPGLAAALAVSLLVSACGLDLSLPERPLRGALNGAIDTGGHLPLAGHTVTLVPEEGSKLTQTSDAAGAFAFSDLVPGVYYVEVNLPGFARFIQPSIRVKAGQTLELGTLAPNWLGNTADAAVITGKVVAGGGASAEGAQIEFVIEPVNTAVARTVVGPDGEFTQTLAPGSYTLNATHPLFVSGKATGVLLAQGQKLDMRDRPISLDLNPAKITGTILKERDGLTAVPAAGAAVTLEDGSSTVTDATGAFELSNLAAVNRTLRVSLSGFHDPANTHAVTLKPGQATPVGSITLSLDRGSISGKVTMGDGRPVSEVTVALTGTPYSAAVSPDSTNPATGSFKIDNIPVGTYEVSAARQGYTRAIATTVAVTANGTTDAGTLTLTYLQGDVQIDDGDAANTAGYARAAAVTLKFNNFVSPASVRASEDNTFASVAFQPYTGTSQAFTLAATEGLHTVYVQYKDASGSISPTYSANVVLDTVAPSAPAVVINGGQGFTNAATTFNLVLTATDSTSGLAGMRVGEAVDGSGNVTASKVSYQRDFALSRTANGDGSKTVYAQFVDHAGNVSTAASSSIVVDTAAPTGSISIARGTAATVTGFTRDVLVQLTETATAEPNGGVVSIKLANSSAGLASAALSDVSTTPVTWLLDGSSEGLKTVHAQLRDSAGNTATVTATITYDKTPPSPATLTLQGSADTNSSTVQLSMTATDSSGLSPTQALTLSEDPLFSGPTTTLPEPFPSNSQRAYTLSSSQGLKQIHARFRDAAGNDAFASVPVTYDTVPPSGTLLVTGALADGTPSTSLTATPTVTLTLTQTGANRYYLAAASDTACPANGYSNLSSPTISHTLSSDGQHTVRVCLLDAAGNSSGFISSSITLDSRAPQSCALSLLGSRPDGRPAPAGLTATASVTATVGSCDETPSSMFISTSAVTCTGTVAWRPYSPTEAVTLASTNGLQTVHGCVKDAAGNIRAMTDGTIKLDTTPPSPATASISGASITSASSVTVLLNTADTNGLDANEAVTLSEDVYFNGATTVGPLALPSPAQLSFPLSSGDGEKTIFIRFRDAAGNDAFTQVKVTRDTTAPTAQLTVRGTLADGTASSTLTTSTAVTLDLVQSGATQYVKGGASMTTCPATGWTNIPAGAISHTLSVASGSETVNVCVRDAANNVTGPVSASITLDQAAPSGCLLAVSGKKKDGTAAPAGFTASPEVTADVTGCAGAPTEVVLAVGTVTCSASAVLDWKPFNASNALNLGNVQALRTVSGCVRDAARNVASLTADTIELDMTPPSSIAVSLVGGAATTNDPAVVLGITAVEANGLESVTVSENALFTAAGTVGPVAMPSNNQVSYTLSSSDGDKQLYVRLRDLVGNEGFGDRLVTLDRTAPAGSFTIVGTLVDGTTSSELTSTPSVTLQLTQTGATGYALGNESLSSCPTAAASYTAITSSISHTLSGTASPRQVRMCLRDAAGNISGPLTQTIVLDAAAPAGCTFSLAGTRPDGRAAPSGLTATSNITASVGGCDETPTSIFVTTGAVTCSTAGVTSWAPFTSSQTVTLSSANGLYTVRGCVRDRAGHISAIQPADITLDTTPPNPATASIVGPSVTSASSVTVSFNASDSNGLDATEAVTVSEDLFFNGATTVGPVAMPSPAQLSFPLSSADGEKTLYVRYRDAAGNEAFTQVKVTRDTTAPTASLTIRGTLADGTASDTLTSTATVSLEIVHGGATQYVKGGASMTSCPASGWTNIPTGFISHTLSVASGSEMVNVCVRDSAGNVTGPLSASITLDGTAPTGCGMSLAGKKKDGTAAPAGFTASQEVTASISGCNDTPAEIVLGVGAITCSATAVLNWQPYNAANTVNLGNVETVRTVSGCVRDAARNVSSISSDSIELDMTAPSSIAVSLVGSAATTNNPAIVLGISSVEANGLESVTVSENALFTAAGTVGPVAMPSNNQVSYTLSSSDGDKQLYVRLRDLVGNEGFGDKQVTLDRTAPTGSFTIVGTLVDGTESSELTSTASVTLQLTQSGATGYALGNELMTACPTAESSYTAIAQTIPHTLSGTASPRQVRLCLRDSAGNLTGPLVQSITLDANPPAGCAFALVGSRPDGRAAPSGLTATSNVTASVSGCNETPVDMFVTTSSVTCASTATLAWTPFTSSQTVTLSSSNDVKTVRGCVRDRAGHVSAIQPADITLDTTPPSPVSLAAVGSAVVSGTSVTLQLTASDSNGLDTAEAVTLSEDVFFNGSTTAGPMAMPTGDQYTFTLSSAEGDKTIYARYRDAAGNDAFTSLVVSRDATAPSGSFVIAGEKADGTASTAVTAVGAVTLQLTQTGASHYVKATTCPAASDSSWQALSGNTISHTLDTSTQGSKTVSLCLKDLAGNTFGPISSSITYDSVAPSGCTVALTGQTVSGGAAPAGLTAKRAVTAALSGCVATPAEVYLTEGTVTCSATAVLPWQSWSGSGSFEVSTTDAQKNVLGCARDAAGNVAPISVGSITLDTTAPANVAAIVSTPSTNSSTVLLTISGTEANGLHPTEAVTLAENLVFTGSSATAPAPLPADGRVNYTMSSGEGIKTIYVRLRDSVGNDGFATASVTYDTTAPTGSLLISGRLANNQSSLEYAATANVTLQISHNGATGYHVANGLLGSCPSSQSAYASFSGAINIPFVLATPEGEKTVSVCLTDAAGNHSDVLTDTITFDKTGPGNCVVRLQGTDVSGLPISGGFTAKPSISGGVSSCDDTPVEITLLEQLSPLVCTTSNPSLTWTPYTGTHSIPLSSGDGNKRVYACVKDRAGNVTSAAYGEIYLDTQGPESVNAGPDGQITNTSTFRFQAGGSDFGSGISGTYSVIASEDYTFSSGIVGPVVFANGGFVNVDVPLSSGDGTKVVYFRFRDAVGNDSQPIARYVMLDTQTPQATVTAMGTLADGTQSPDFATSDYSGNKWGAVQIYSDNARQAVFGDENLTDCTDPSLNWEWLSGTGNDLRYSYQFTSTLTPLELHVCLKDEAGNISPTPFVDTIVVDDTPPQNCQLTVGTYRADRSPGPANATAYRDSTYTITCDEGGVEMVIRTETSAYPSSCYPYMSANWTSFYSPYAGYLNGVDGPYQIGGCVRDAAHNVSALPVQYINLDTQPPQLVSISINNGAQYLNKQFAEWMTPPELLDAGFSRANVVVQANGAYEMKIVDEYDLYQLADAGRAPRDWESFTGYTTHDFQGQDYHYLHAEIRDEVGNTGNWQWAGINIDTIAPDAGDFGFFLPSGAENTNTRSVVIQNINHPYYASVTAIQFAESNDPYGGTCDPYIYQNVGSQSLSWTYNFTLGATQGQHGVCARWVDYAGNYSPSHFEPISLDETGPSRPIMLTKSKTFNPGSSTDQTVQIVNQPATDHWKWQISNSVWGGGYWSDYVPADGGSTLDFQFPLWVDSTDEDGVPNFLSIRELDTAGNASPEASVTFTVDTSPPKPVTLDTRWVSNENGAATLFWQPSSSPDVVDHLLYYGASAGSPATYPEPTGYNGTYANQGASPLKVGAVNSARLNGLPNGTQTFVTVRPVDAAGNIGGPPPYSATMESVLQPNEISPTPIASVALFTGNNLWSSATLRMVTGDGWAYVSGRKGADCSSDVKYEIVPIDLTAPMSPVQRGQIQSVPAVAQGTRVDLGVPGNCDSVPEMVLTPGHLIVGFQKKVIVYSLRDPSAPAYVNEVDLSTVVPSATRITTIAARGDLLFIGLYNQTIVVLDLAKLRDSSAATFPGVADVIGLATTGPSSPTGFKVTRDKLIVTDAFTELASYYSIADLVSSPRGTWDNSDKIGQSQVGIPFSTPLLSGNLLFVPDFQSLSTSVYDLRSFWSGAVGVGSAAYVLPYGSADQMAMVGSTMYFPDAYLGVRAVDLADLNNPRPVLSYREQGVNGVAISGNYMLLSISWGELRVLELAKPTGLRSVATAAGGSSGIDVGSGLVYSGGGNVHDLLNGATPKPLATGTDTCAYDLARFDDETVVSARGRSLFMQDLRLLIDRDGATAWSPATDSNVLTLPAGVRATSVAAYGDYLIVGETRDASAGGPGLFLEVFDARRLRDGRATTWLTTANSVASLQIGSVYGPQMQTHLSVWHGRVSLTASENWDTLSNSVFFVDLRDVFDDNGATVLDAADIQGVISVPQARATVLRGNRAYVTGPNGPRGFEIWDTSKAVDSDASTVMSAADLIVSRYLPTGTGLDVVGNYAIVTPYQADSYGFTAFDVSVASNPIVLSTTPATHPLRYCTPNGDSTGSYMHNHLKVAGARAYVGGFQRVEVLGLE